MHKQRSMGEIQGSSYTDRPPVTMTADDPYVGYAHTEWYWALKEYDAANQNAVVEGPLINDTLDSRASVQPFQSVVVVDHVIEPTLVGVGVGR